MSETEIPPPVLSFAVRFQTWRDYNREFAGRGTLEVRASEIVCSGRPRGNVFNRRQAVRTIPFASIRNAARTGRVIRFAIDSAGSTADTPPFLMAFRDEPTAIAVLAALPQNKDTEAREAEQFTSRLNELSSERRRVFSVTNVIIAANVLAFVVMGFLGAGWLDTASMTPYIKYAANNGAATTDGEWWRLITSMFTHYGLLHLALNMWALFEIGHLVERLLGRRLFAAMYFGSGTVGGLATLLWHGDKVWSAGASGAIFGVYGALLGYLWREKHGVPRNVLRPLAKSAISFAAYNLIWGALHPQIDNVAHLGGLISGVLFGWISAMPVDREIRVRATPQRLIVSVGIAAGALLVGMIAAPTYNYRVADELRWSDLLQPRIRQEEGLIAEQTTALASASASKQQQDQAKAWLETKGIPFYDSWRAELVTQPFTPGKLTARRRDALAEICAMKVASYRELASATDWTSSSTISRWTSQEQTIQRAVQALAQLNEQTQK